MASTTINFQHPSKSLQTDAVKDKRKNKEHVNTKAEASFEKQKQRSNYHPDELDHPSKNGIQNVNTRNADIRNYPASCHTQAKDSLL